MPTGRCPRCAAPVTYTPPAKPRCSSCGYPGPARASPKPAAAPKPARAALAPSAAKAPAAALPPRTAPYPGHPQPANPKRSRTGLRVTLGVVALLVFAGLGAGAYFLLRGGASCGEDERAYKDSDGFRFCAPSAWDLETGMLGTNVAVLAPLQGASDEFRENVNVVVTSAGITTIQDGAEEQLRGLQRALTDYRKVSATFGEWAGEPSHKVVYTFRQGAYDLRGEQTLVLHGGDAFVFTFTAEQGHQEEVRSEVSAIAASFEFT